MSIPRSERAWKEFRDRIADLSATMIETAWLGARFPHRVKCKEGHACSPTPDNVRKGQGICLTCAGLDPDVAWREFQERIKCRGGTVLEASWRGALTGHRVVCAEGHLSSPKPNNVQQRGGFCLTCAGRDSDAAWALFQAHVKTMGGRVVEQAWLGNNVPHRVICVQGHQASPTPGSVQQGGGICAACVGRDPEIALLDFRLVVSGLGGTLLEAAWLGAKTPHRMRCKQEHEVAPTPSDVKSGQGLCHICAGKFWDVFYVVTAPLLGLLKFGITSGTPQGRLKDHERDGYKTILRQLEGLPPGVALDVERSVRAALRAEGFQPVKGREYFSLSALSVVLTTVDAFPIPALI